MATQEITFVDYHDTPLVEAAFPQLQEMRNDEALCDVVVEVSRLA